VTVAETLSLTDQPSTGQIKLVPLGGNGVSAPKSMYEVQATLAHDASGGIVAFTLTRDERFASICTLMNGKVIGAAAGVEMLFTMRSESDGPVANGFANAVPISTVGSSSIAVWNPPPIMTMTTWSLHQNNVNGDSLDFAGWFYNFDVRILELSPMWRILANLPRPGTMDSFSAA